MKSAKTIILLFVFALLAVSVFAAQINSGNYKQKVIISSGGENTSSSSYKMNIATGIISVITTSQNYINKLGLLNIFLLANSQPCTSASQCEGGFCCSNLCKSSNCTSEQGSQTGGGSTASSGGSGSSGGAGSTGGGGGIITKITKEPVILQEETKSFSVSPSFIKEKTALGAAKTNSIKIKNTGNKALNFNLKSADTDGFISLSDTGFSLDAGHEKILQISIIGKKLGSYIARIDATAEGITKSISVIIEVKSELVLFDVKMDIPSNYKQVVSGNEVKAQITLLNIATPKKVDVTATYLIKDMLGRILYESSETFGVEKQLSFVKSFRIPKYLKPGDYLSIIELKYEKSFAVSSDLFSIVSEKGSTSENYILPQAAFVSFLSVLFVLAVLFVYILFSKRIKN